MSIELVSMLWCIINVARLIIVLCFFFFNDTATTEIYTLSLHDALPIFSGAAYPGGERLLGGALFGEPAHDPLDVVGQLVRSEEHTSELQSPCNLVCRLLLEKKNMTETSRKLTNVIYCLIHHPPTR